MLTPEQIEFRKQAVFASDMPRIARLLPAKWDRVTWGDVWDEKLGLVPAWDGNATTRWGELVEPIIANTWAAQNGRKVKRNESSVLHPEIKIIGATCDYFTDDEEALPVECKYVGTFMAKKWNCKPPDYVEVQVQTQLAVHGKKRAFVAARLEGSENVVDSYVIEFNPTVWSQLVTLSKEFWAFVERRERPTT